MRGVHDDIMLYSYLINPTHTTHVLSDVVARFTVRPLQQKGEALLPEAANAIHQLVPILRRDVEELGAREVYEQIDFPLVNVLRRMEDVGVRIDSGVLNRMGEKLSFGNAARGRGNIRAVRAALQYQLSEPARRRSLQQDEPAEAHEVWQGQSGFHCAGRAGRTGDAQSVPRMVLEYRQLAN